MLLRKKVILHAQRNAEVPVKAACGSGKTMYTRQGLKRNARTAGDALGGCQSGCASRWVSVEASHANNAMTGDSYSASHTSAQGARGARGDEAAVLLAGAHPTEGTERNDAPSAEVTAILRKQHFPSTKPPPP
eukprot:3844095-Pleurochrysis_carterae.AAC.1